MIPTRNHQVAYTLIDEQAALVSQEDSLMYWLDPVATRVWQLADGGKDTNAIAASLCEEFDVDQTTAVTDVTAMVEEFCRKGLFHTDP